MNIPVMARVVAAALMALVVVTLGASQPGLAQNPQAAVPQGESAVLNLITDPQLPEPVGAPIGADLRERHVPLGIPVSREEFSDMKRDAASNPDPAVTVLQADDVEEFSGPGPLSHTINVSFTGLDRFTAQNGGFFWYPPDTIVAASPTHVLEGTNSALRLSTTAGGTVATMNSNSFFSASSSTAGFVFDPKVYYDRNSVNPRFFIVALSMCCSPFTTTRIARIWIAVSRSTAPASLAAAEWCRYFLDARRGAGTINDSWADYPGIGFGADGLVISVNNFTWATNTFTFAFVRALRKLALENNAVSCASPSSAAVKVFQASTIVNSGAAFALQPVQHYTNPSSFTGVTNPIYLMATQFGLSTSVRLWRIANVAGTATFAGPFLLPGGLSFGLPPNSPQPGTFIPLSTGDNRMTQAAATGNLLHGVFATTCNIGGGLVESCIRYVQVLVGGPTLSGAYVAGQQLTFGSTNAFYWWPGVAVNLFGKILVVFQRASATTFLTSGYTGKTSASTIFEGLNAMPLGSCSRTGFGIPARTGDYVGAQLEPAGTSFWLAAERAVPVGGLAGCQWSTTIRKVTPP